MPSRAKATRLNRPGGLLGMPVLDAAARPVSPSEAGAVAVFEVVLEAER
jgi:hypothetical protein